MQLKGCGKRQKLIIDSNLTRPDNWIEPHQGAVTPSFVMRTVERAIRSGWNPLQYGGEFRIDGVVLGRA